MGLETKPRQPRRIDLIPGIPAEADKRTPLLDFAEEAWDEEMTGRPEIDPENLGAQLSFIHEHLGLSTHSTYGSLGKLLGGEGAHTAKQMLQRGTDFGNRDLNKRIRFLFAGVSILEGRYPNQSGEPSLIGDRLRIMQTTINDQGNSAWRLYEAGQPDLALATIKKSQMYNAEQE